MAIEVRLADNEKAERCQLVTLVDVNQSDDGNYEWEAIGHGIEDSDLDMSVTSSTTTDILGRKETDISSVDKTQTFDDMKVRGGLKLFKILADIDFNDDYQRYSQFTIMIVFAHLSTGNDEQYPAKVYKNCTIAHTRQGGSTQLEYDIEISLSNEVTIGYVTNPSSPIFVATTEV
ncbi:MAG: hypothetical protein ATN36_06600 [Epulopiscium sp. Nele67-Bin005]|nr:MAG: hypothetical protein ATN36_06600 [Epulopiscium sp. Nele67-Bin005]